MGKYQTIIFALALFLAGCVGRNTPKTDFIELSDSQAQSILKQINQAASNFKIAKSKAEIQLIYTENDKPQQKTCKLLLLWAPKVGLRARIDYFNVTVMTILFDGQTWYIVNEIDNIYYSCNDISKVESTTIPQELFLQLAQIPQGWLGNEVKARKVFMNETSIMVEEEGLDYSKTLVFPKTAAMPSYLSCHSSSGDSIEAHFSKAQTNMVIRATTFKAIFTNYEHIKLD